MSWILNKCVNLADVDEKLNITNRNILIEKQQISKAEEMLFFFQTSLLEHNKALNRKNDDCETIREHDKSIVQIAESTESINTLVNSYHSESLEKRSKDVSNKKYYNHQSSRLPNEDSIKNYSKYFSNKSDELSKKTNSPGYVTQSPDRLHLPSPDQIHKEISREPFSNLDSLIVTDQILGLDTVLCERGEKCDGEESVDLKRKHNVNIDTGNNKDITNKRCRAKKAKGRSLHYLQIPELRNHKINKIVVENGCIICGSKGLILRYVRNFAFLYKTGTTNDILSAEVLYRRPSTCLVAITISELLIFDVVATNPLRVIDKLAFPEPWVNRIFNNKSNIFIPVSSKEVKVLDSGTWKVNCIAAKTCENMSQFFLCSLKGEYRLVTLVDNLLYKTKGSTLTNLKVIPEITSVKNIMPIQKDKFMCYSENMIWFLNKDCEIMETLAVDSEIKHVNNDAFSICFVDSSDRLYVYSIKDGFRFGKKLFECSLDREPSAIAIMDNHIYAGIDDSVQVITIK